MPVFSAPIFPFDGSVSQNKNNLVLTARETNYQLHPPFNHSHCQCAAYICFLFEGYRTRYKGSPHPHDYVCMEL